MVNVNILKQYIIPAKEALANGILVNIQAELEPDPNMGINPHFVITWKDGKSDIIEIDNYNVVSVIEDIDSLPTNGFDGFEPSIEEFKEYLMNPVTMEESFVIEEKYQKEDGFGAYDGYQDFDDKKAYQDKLDREKQDRDNNLLENKIITLDVDDEEDSLEDILKYIKTIGDTGHSFTIDVDPEGDERKLFSWDGDGWDKINNINIKNTEMKNITESNKSCNKPEGSPKCNNGKCTCNKKVIKEAPLDNIVQQYSKEYYHAQKTGDQEKMQKLKAGLLTQFQRAGVNWQENPTATEILAEGRIIKIAQASNSFNSYKQNLEKYFNEIGSKRYFNELLADAQKLGVRGEGTDESLEKGVYLKINESKDSLVNNILKEGL